VEREQFNEDQILNSQIRPAEPDQTMQKQLRNESFWLLGWGIINIAFAALNSPFGVTLLLIGIVSYFVRSPAMFLVHGVVFAWAAITNLFVDGFGSAFFALILGISAFQTIRRYASYRQPTIADNALSTRETDAVSQKNDPGRYFPWAGTLLAFFSLGGIVTIFIMDFVRFVFFGAEESMDILIFVAGVVLNLGVVAFAMSLAAVLSGYRPKIVAFFGTILGGLTVIIQIALLSVSG